MKVKFFIIGAPKCGTTALGNYLNQHPHVCMAQPKEPWYFSDDLTVNRPGLPKTIGEYHRKYFSNYDVSIHKSIGEASPSYMVSSNAIKNILNYNPDAKFIALVRNPVDIAYAMHSTLVSRGINFENIIDFRKAWYSQDDRLLGHKMPPNTIKPILLQYKNLASVGTQLENVLKRVKKENLMVIVNDDMRSNTQECYKKTLNFLKLEEFEDVDLKLTNVNRRWKSESLRRLYILAKSINKKSPVNFNFGLLHKIRESALCESPRDHLNTEFRSELAKVFQPEIKKLSEILSRDFSNWK